MLLLTMSEDPEPSHSQEVDSSDLFAVRKAKLDRMREAGTDPFSANCPQSHTSEQAKALLPEELEEGPR